MLAQGIAASRLKTVLSMLNWDKEMHALIKLARCNQCSTSVANSGRLCLLLTPVFALQEQSGCIYSRNAAGLMMMMMMMLHCTAWLKMSIPWPFTGCVCQHAG